MALDERLAEEADALARTIRGEHLSTIREEQLKEGRMVDVVGYWQGFNSDGDGLVEYQGRTYVCKVLARRCKQVGAPVNLRRTRLRNFVNWA